jgi:hypothetical protein
MSKQPNPVEFKLVTVKDANGISTFQKELQELINTGWAFHDVPYQIDGITVQGMFKLHQAAVATPSPIVGLN